MSDPTAAAAAQPACPASVTIGCRTTVSSGSGVECRDLPRSLGGQVCEVGVRYSYTIANSGPPGLTVKVTDARLTRLGPTSNLTSALEAELGPADLTSALQAALGPDMEIGGQTNVTVTAAAQRIVDLCRVGTHETVANVTVSWTEEDGESRSCTGSAVYEYSTFSSPPPSSTSDPTSLPTARPTAMPTVSPMPTTSRAPSSEPTQQEAFMTIFLSQNFDITTDRELDENETAAFQNLLINYTTPDSSYGPRVGMAPGRVQTTCVVTSQQTFPLIDTTIETTGGGEGGNATVVVPLGSVVAGGNATSADAGSNASPYALNLRYTMTWSSIYTPTFTYGEAFRQFINGNLTRFTEDMHSVGLTLVTKAETVVRDAPPGTVPPTTAPTWALPASLAPSAASFASPPPSAGLTPAPPRRSLTAGGIAGVSVAGVFVLLAVGVVAYRKREMRIHEARKRRRLARKKRRLEAKAAAAPQDEEAAAAPAEASKGASEQAEPANRRRGEPDGEVAGAEEPPVPVVHVEDDFRDSDVLSQYKDKNLERVRTKVEGNVTGAEGMINLAVTRALIPAEDEDEVGDTVVSWGKEGRDCVEIEAGVLSETNDWLKRRQGAPAASADADADARNAFLQKMMNQVVICVRRGALGSDAASRIVHECAAMLGLPLAQKLPETTVVITSMRFSAGRDDVLRSFEEFGNIEDAAVAPNERGFGIVRYFSAKSVHRVMSRFRTGDIVVQDVAVTVRVLTSEFDQ